MLRCSRTECVKNHKGRCFPSFKEWSEHAEPRPDSKERPFYKPWSEGELKLPKALKELDDVIREVVLKLRRRNRCPP